MMNLAELKKKLRSPDSVTLITVLWLAVIFPGCVAAFYWLFGFLPAEWNWVNDDRVRTQRDLRSTVSLVLGLIGSLYLIAQMFSWAKSKRRPGGTSVEVIECYRCGAENQIDYPMEPEGFRSGCGMLLLVPMLSAGLLYPLGNLLKWLGVELRGGGWIVLLSWFVITTLGFGVVRVLKIAALDQRDVEKSPEWRTYQDEVERISSEARCAKCGQNPYG